MHLSQGRTVHPSIKIGPYLTAPMDPDLPKAAVEKRVTGREENAD
jgi:hypothetical protein